MVEPSHNPAQSLSSNCSSTASWPLRPFRFEQDTFSFANELIWSYRFDERTGRMRTCNAYPPPSYAHRCFVLVRSARQFFYHARFEPGQPVAEPAEYRRLIREIVSRSPRRPSLKGRQVVIPGYDCLRSFSRGQESLLKANCGRAWQSYFVRSHWRMVAPTGRAHQEKVAGQLLVSLRERSAPIVHLFRFPRITINHGIVLFRAVESDRQIEFDSYDPNIPEHLVKLFYERAARTFTFPPAKYWPGGPLNVFEMYVGGLY